MKEFSDGKNLEEVLLAFLMLCFCFNVEMAAECVLGYVDVVGLR